ncbi:MAG: prolipoprotein diacylglyceryl transferase [Zetaproteobacteria bacterium CG2_30_46_52]|nr:MAG: prolipoprotein diacylglyceryl transferase [Zetaproteobacteria bacterium CG2_30_46_52]
MMAPHIDPVALQLGPLAIHWYGLMYVFAFASAWKLVQIQLKERKLWGKVVAPEAYENLFTWLILGVILGGRLGYVLFYNPSYYASHPIEIFYVWNGGMSFHGGFIGPVMTGWWYCRKSKLPFITMLDLFATVAPLGLAFGRMGNFINGELWGRVVTNPENVPWAMIFPGAGDLPRHPSQLYELGLEGLLLFALLWLTRKKDWVAGTRISIFIMGYALARIFCENFREPDAHIGFLFGGITMGMLLSSAMFVTGLITLLWLRKKT